MRGLGSFCYRRRRFVLLGWIAVLVGLIFLSAVAGGDFRTEFSLPGSESQRAFDLLEERGASDRSGELAQIVFRSEAGLGDPEVRRTMEEFFSELVAAIENSSIRSPYEPENSFQISPGGDLAYAELTLGDRSQEQYLRDADRIKEIWSEIELAGLQVELGGDVLSEDEEPSEVIGLIAAVIILLIAFGSLLAMGLPIITALFGVGSGVALIGMMTHILAVPDFTVIIATLIGIAVGIDYSLLIVTRYRQGLQDGLEPYAAMVRAMDTAGRAAVVAGLTVVISLLGLLLMNLDFMRSVALATMFAVLFTMAASVTLLPALLGFVGRNIDRLGLPHRAGQAEGDVARSFWFRWSRVIQKNPWPAFILSGSLLIALALPVFAMRLGFADAGNNLESDTTRRSYDLLADGFGPGFNGPILIVIDTSEGPGDAATISAMQKALASTEGVAAVSPPQPLGDTGLTLIQAFPTSEPQAKETSQLVHRLRDQTIPDVASETGIVALTTGLPSLVVDFSDFMAARLPWFIGAVLLLSFLLLMIVFHSVVVPLKAVVMNLLSIGSAFGAAILVFQWGFLASLLGVGKEGPIEAWAPMFIFAFVFGLSMDYEVFLLSRVKEEYDSNGGDNGLAVADGLAATGRVISAAALIMVVVFGSLVLGDAHELKLFGFTLAFAIFIDATVVRLILVPSAMELMGKANWWAPAWLVRYLPTIRVDSVQGQE